MRARACADERVSECCADCASPRTWSLRLHRAFGCTASRCQENTQLTLVPGVATPTFVTYIFAIVCLVGLAVQPVGFIGAFRVRLTSPSNVYC